MQPLRSLLLMLSAGLMTACAVGPNYRPPDVDVSTEFLGKDGVTHRPARNKTELESWWAGFEDPLLTHFVDLALGQNLDIVQAAARVTQSRAALRQTDSALLPAGKIAASEKYIRCSRSLLRV